GLAVAVAEANLAAGHERLKGLLPLSTPLLLRDLRHCRLDDLHGRMIRREEERRGVGRAALALHLAHLKEPVCEGDPHVLEHHVPNLACLLSCHLTVLICVSPLGQTPPLEASGGVN